MRGSRRRAPVSPPVSLRVERLVLEGLDLTHAQAVVVQRSFERELTRLVTQSGHGANWRGATVPAMPAAPVHTDGTPRPAQLGRDVARSVYSTLRKSP